MAILSILWGFLFALHLPVSEQKQGIRRLPPIPVLSGHETTSPAIALLPDGQVIVALVRLDGDLERIWIAWGDPEQGALQVPVQVTEGARAWAPRLGVDLKGGAWLAWSGSETAPGPGPPARNIYLRQVYPPKPGPIRTVVAGAVFASEPDLAFTPDGVLHLVWEQAVPPSGSAIFYAALGPDGSDAEPKRLSEGALCRRPRVLAEGGRLHVAWDCLVDREATGQLDPNYDVFLATMADGRFEHRAVTCKPGIQAAPSLALAPGGGVLIGYHSSEVHALVKWWRLRRLRGGVIEELAASDPAAALEPGGENQGAEFPEILSSDGRIVVFSRPSQGAFVQLVAQAGITAPMDLDQGEWGARGMRSQAVAGRSGRVFLVRRARSKTLLETLRLPPPAGPPAFRPAPDPAPAEKVRALPPVFHDRAGRLVYLGDLHMHSAASDATGPPDEVLARAWVRGQSFAALTDHDSIVGSVRFPSAFDEIAWLTDVFDALPRFVALHAYEWTTPSVADGGAGHRNVYFRGNAPVRRCGFRTGCPTTRALFEYLREQGGIAIPHHTPWTGTDWQNADPALEPAFEIVSIHGFNERPRDPLVASRGAMPGMYAVDGLGRGLRFGLVGGSDAHGILWHHSFGRKRDPWNHGLTGLSAAALTREALFEALVARRTFATSGIPLWLDFGVGGLSMGERGPSASPVEVYFEAEALQPITEVVVVRDGKELHRERPSTTKVLGRFEDAPSPGDHAYYLRVTLESESVPERGWSSPVFVEVRK